ncbi:hypothetical protein F5148DRAFT_975528 [Russula earlei]|uniref:Uncharacterized protein n=1 Tax=Russula earlei TaxID=71964 RepID=A0ACC0UI23_9AGAM|nr:hypothetical protein F5148DRAFT_975528 [Russula earlei]
MDLYVDGNIAQMFGPESASLYFSRLLGVEARFLRPTVSQEWPRAFFLTSPAVQNARPSFFINGQPAWLLDYAIGPVGTVVPQRIWSSGGLTDTQRQSNASLNMPIFFVRDDLVGLGLPLLDALSGDRAMLRGAGEGAPVGDSSTTYIRINWPGYDQWSTQIMTKDQTSQHSVISLQKFAKRVASAVNRFLDVSASSHSSGHRRFDGYSDRFRGPSVLKDKTQTGESETEGSPGNRSSFSGPFRSRGGAGSRFFSSIALLCPDVTTSPDYRNLVVSRERVCMAQWLR